MRLRYLLVAASLLALSGWSLAQDCGNQRVGWNTLGFFRSATIAEVQTCLEAGADASARTRFGLTPGSLALRRDAPRSIILALGAARELTDCGRWNTPEFFRWANVTEVAACLKTGAEVDARTESGLAPLHSESFETMVRPWSRA